VIGQVCKICCGAHFDLTLIVDIFFSAVFSSLSAILKPRFSRPSIRLPSPKEISPYFKFKSVAASEESKHNIFLEFVFFF